MLQTKMKKMRIGLVLCIVSMGLFLTLGTISPVGATKHTTTTTFVIATDYDVGSWAPWLGYRTTKLDVRTQYEHYHGEKFYFWNQRLVLYTTTGGLVPPPVVPITVYYNGQGGGEYLRWQVSEADGWPKESHDYTYHIFIDLGKSTDSIRFCKDPDIDSPIDDDYRIFEVKCWNWRSGIIHFEYDLDY